MSQPKNTRNIKSQINDFITNIDFETCFLYIKTTDINRSLKYVYLKLESAKYFLNFLYNNVSYSNITFNENKKKIVFSYLDEITIILKFEIYHKQYFENFFENYILNTDISFFELSDIYSFFIWLYGRINIPQNIIDIYKSKFFINKKTNKLTTDNLLAYNLDSSLSRFNTKYMKIHVLYFSNKHITY